MIKSTPTNFHPNAVTIMRASGARTPMTKVWTRKSGSWSKRAYGNTTFFDVLEERTLDTLEDVAQLLADAEADTSLLMIRGQLQDSITRVGVRRRKGVFLDVPRAFATIDIDDMPWCDAGLVGPDYSRDGAMAIWAALTSHYPALQSSGYVYQWSSSAGVRTDVAKIHFYVLLDAARDEQWWQSVYNTTGKPWANKAGSRYCKNGDSTFDFDHAPLRTVQPNYIAPPVFDGCTDPLEGRRFGIVQGSLFSTATLDRAVQARAGSRLITAPLDAKAPKIRNTKTGKVTQTRASGEVEEHFEQLLASLHDPTPALAQHALASISGVLALLKSAPAGDLNNARFEAVKGLRRTSALEVLGLDSLLDALTTAMSSNPHAKLTANAYRAELRRAVAYAYNGHTRRAVTSDDSLAVHRVNVQGRYITADHIANCATRCVLLRSPMGTGKSTAIGSFIARDPYVPVRAVAPRTSLVRAMAHAFDLVHYKDEDATNAQRVATTLHSLWKMRVQPGQVLVIDEVEQALDALLDEVDDPCRALDTARAHVNAASRIILADAHAGHKAQRLMVLLGIDAQEVTLVHNPWRPSNRALEVWTSDEAWSLQCERALVELTAAVPEAVRSGAPVFAACTTLEQAAQVAQAVREAHPTARVLEITSETTRQDHVREFMGDANAHASKYDAIITSPSVQSGVSLDVHVSLAVCFARLGSWTEPNKAVQQLGRARNVTRSIWVADTTEFNFEECAELIQSRWTSARRAAFGVVWGHNEHGDVDTRPMRDDLYEATAQNEAHSNAQRNAGLARALHLLVHAEGYTLREVQHTSTPAEKQATKHAKAERKAKREEAKRAHAQLIHEAPIATPDEVAELLEKGELDEDEERAMKHGLIAMYRGAAPELEHCEELMLDRRRLKSARMLALVELPAEQFDARLAAEVARVHAGHAPLERLHKSELVRASMWRELLRSTGFWYMLDRDLTDEQRTYTPVDFWTEQRTERAAATLERYGVVRKGAVHTIIHQLLRYDLGLRLEGQRTKRDGKRVRTYTMAGATLAHAFGWIEGLTVRYADDYERADHATREGAAMWELTPTGAVLQRAPANAGGTVAERIKKRACAPG